MTDAYLGLIIVHLASLNYPKVIGYTGKSNSYTIFLTEDENIAYVSNGDSGV